MRTKLAFVVAVPMLLAAGCSGDKPAANATAVAPPVVTVHAKDFAFDAPSEISAGVTTFRLVNDGPGLHHMQIVRLDSGKTGDDLMAAMKKPGPPPAWATFVTGPNVPLPGTESNATLDIKVGSYVIMCLVDIPGGVPHFTKGMFKPLTVTARAAGAVAAAMPTADIAITLQDYSFTISTPITAGKHTFSVATQPGQPHEVEIFKLAKGKTKDDLMTWMNGKMDTPPPLEAVLAGVAATSTSFDVRFTADFTPGDYLMACFLPDKTGKAHIMNGMFKTFTI